MKKILIGFPTNQNPPSYRSQVRIIKHLSNAEASGRVVAKQTGKKSCRNSKTPVWNEQTCQSVNYVWGSDLLLGDGFDTDEHLEGIHRALIRRSLSQSVNVKKRANELLGVKNYQTLDVRLKRLDIDKP